MDQGSLLCVKLWVFGTGPGGTLVRPQAFSGSFRNVEDGEVVATMKDCARTLFDFITDLLGKLVDLAVAAFMWARDKFNKVANRQHGGETDARAILLPGDGVSAMELTLHSSHRDHKHLTFGSSFKVQPAHVPLPSMSPRFCCQGSAGVLPG